MVEGTLNLQITLNLLLEACYWRENIPDTYGVLCPWENTFLLLIRPNSDAVFLGCIQHGYMAQNMWLDLTAVINVYRVLNPEVLRGSWKYYVETLPGALGSRVWVISTEGGLEHGSWAQITCGPGTVIAWMFSGKTFPTFDCELMETSPLSLKVPLCWFVVKSPTSVPSIFHICLIMFGNCLL